MCRADSCGCDPLEKTYCKPLGVCIEGSDSFTCQCPTNYAGDRCEKCAKGRGNYDQGCPPVSGCPKCDHGYCDKSSGTGVCICDEGWSGELCNVQGSFGKADIEAANGLRIGGIIIGVFIILATLAFIAYTRIAPKGGQRYLPVDADMESAAEMSLFDDEDEENGFPHRRFDDREPEEEEERASPKRHEPQVEEKLFTLDD